MPQIKREKTEVLSVSLSKVLSKNLRQFAKERNSSVSQVTTDALNRYIFITEWRKLQRAFRPAFEKLGIKRDDDVEKYFG